MERSARDGFALAIGASAVFFLVYAWRLCPTLSLLGDSGELVGAAAVWGVPHAPGYPLFTALAHAFTWLPLHSIAWRVHLTSAVFHAGAVGAIALATLTTTKSRLAAIVAGCALGLQRSFFLGSLYAEVFPLNDLFFAALLLLALRLRERCLRGDAFLFAFVAGLAAAHHMMIALAAPSLLWLTLRPLAPHARLPKRATALAALFLAPVVLFYSLIPIAAARDPVVSSGDVHDLASFVALLGRSDYGGVFSAVHGGGHGSGPERLAALGSLLAEGFGPLALLAAIVGAIVLTRRNRAVGLALLLAIFLTGPFFAWRNALGTSTEEALAFFERFTTMCAVPIALLAGAGVAAVATRVASSRGARIAGCAALAGWGAFAVYGVRNVDLAGDERALAFAHDLVLHTPEDALVLLSGDAPGAAALYVCAIERRCGDRLPIAPGGLFLPWAMTQLRRRHPELAIPWSSGPALKHTHELVAAAIATRPVFVYPDLLQKDPRLSELFTPIPDRLLFRLWPAGGDPAPARDAFLVSARAAAGLDVPPRDICEGCALPSPRTHPTQEMQLVHAYEAAAVNHARTAMGIPAARDLVPALLARAGDFGKAQPSAESPSTAK